MSTPRGDVFFYRFAIFMTVLVFSGFILNAVFNWESIERFTVWIFLHGLFCAAWYLLLVNQLRLVRNNRLALHRRMGKLSGLLFVGFLVSGLLMSADLFESVLANPDLDLSLPEARVEAGGAVGGIMLQWVLAMVLYLLGLLCIRKPVHHKRFMIATSIQMAPASLTRHAAVFGLPPFIVLPVVLALYGTIMVHDWRTDRRVHWSTLTALGVFSLLPIGFFTVFSSQGWGDFVTNYLSAG